MSESGWAEGEEETAMSPRACMATLDRVASCGDTRAESSSDNKKKSEKSASYYNVCGVIGANFVQVYARFSKLA